MHSFRLSIFRLGLTAALLCSACDEGREALEASQNQASAKEENPPAQAEVGVQKFPQSPSKGAQPEPAATGPEVIQMAYEPKVQLGGLYTFAQLDIPVSDGITLEALVTEPTALGKHPLILMPASWTLNRHEYEIPARQWASQGFVVISYTSRGFHGSGGEIDIAGPPTVKDLSDLIDWAGQNTKADIDRVGALGISYGGGTALLAAAEDPRIDAVASLSGWSDLRFSTYPHQTGAGQSGDFLSSTADSFGRTGAVMKAIDTHLKKGEVENALQIMDERSAIKRVDKINQNETAVFIAQAWNDGFFPPSQFLDFYKALDTEKRILLQPGDHASSDGLGIVGLPDSSWKLTLEWMRKHVKGDDITIGSPVVIVSNDNKSLILADSIEDWQADMKTLHLGPPQAEGVLQHHGAMTPLSVFSWHSDIEGGEDTAAQSGTMLISGMLLGTVGVPELVSEALIDRKHAALWKSKPSLQSQNLSGAPVVHLNVSSPQESVTMVVYLYESAAGMASLISYSPITVRDIEVDTPKPFSVKLEPTQWNLAPGSELLLVVDTVDNRYQSETRKGQQLRLSSESAFPAKIELPLRPAF